MDEADPVPRYRDTSSSRFHRAQGLSPEDTWEALTSELARVLDDARDNFFRRRLRVDAERVRWWHGAIFKRLFPYEGGRFREAHEPAFFGVRLPGGRVRQLEGVPAADIPRELGTVCREFNSGVDVLGEDPERASLIDRTRAAAGLYGGLVRVHPFVDGNHRVGFVALSAALWSLGLPNVEFASDGEMLAHDDALVPALIPDGDHAEPFARLLAERIGNARMEGR